MITFQKSNSDNNDFKQLVAMLDADLNSRYGLIQEQYNQFNRIDSIKHVIVAYSDNIPVGCGCFKKYNSDTIEIKRMFVKPENRGHGIARKILFELEKWAFENGYKNSILETGFEQPEANKLYINFGFEIIENYGQYAGNPNSICMHKAIAY